MRELTYEEMDQVDGGVAPIVIGIGMSTAYGAYSGWRSGGVGGMIGGAALGLAGGVFGGVAAAATGVARGMFAAYSFATHVINDEANRYYKKSNGS